MRIGSIATLLLGSLAFWWGIRFGRLLVRKGSTANDLFKGKTSVSLACLGIYVGLVLLALHVPQFQGLPLQVRVYGMAVTWTLMRIILLGFCGVAFIVSWRTARLQVLAVILLGILGIGSFNAAEAYFLAPIHSDLIDNLKPNGIYQQTSSSSCAPAALATILHQWKVDAPESLVAELAGTSRLGTSMPQLVVAAKTLGMDGIELSPTWEQIRQINRPGVLATWLIDERGKNAHATALIGISANQAAIADPAFGEVFQVNRAQFSRIWRQQYVPIFHPTDVLLTPAKTADYLNRLGYSTPKADNLSNTIRQFQRDQGIPETGELDSLTVLLLSGPFLEGVPTLKDFKLAG